MRGYYKSKENVVHTDDPEERVCKGEIIEIIGYEESFGCTEIEYWRFGINESVSLVFSNKTIEEVEKLYFEKV